MQVGRWAFVQNLFRIRTEEANTTALAFTYLFFAIGAFILGRIARTVLFLELPNYKQQLPLAYIGIAASVSFAMYLYSFVQGALRRDRTNAITLLILIAGTLSFRFALSSGDETVLWAFYFWVEIFGTFLVVQFWTLTSEIFHSRQAKRLFGFIGGGGVLSNIFIGLFVSGSVRGLGTENLIYLISACMGMSLLAVLGLGRCARTELERARNRSSQKNPDDSRSGAEKRSRIFATRHVRLVALVVILTYMVSTLVDYQFQAIIGDTIPGKDDRSAYLGYFFALTGLIGGAVQFFATARILERFGLLVALLVLPVAMLMGSIGLLTVPFALTAITLTKGSENCLRYTLNDSTLQLLYLPLPSAVRSRAKATIDGILKPLSIGAAGFFMALMVGRLDRLLGLNLGHFVTTERLSWAVLAVLAIWIAALVALRHEYLKSLLQTLSKRRLNFADTHFEISDEHTVNTMKRALDRCSTTVGEILHALELVPFVSGRGRDGLYAQVSTLLSHESEDIRVETLRTLREGGAELPVDTVQTLLQDPMARVRAEAVLAIAATKSERAIRLARPLLNDAELRVRSATITALIRFCGLDGMLASADNLKTLLESHNPTERAEAARILGEIGIRTFYQPLLPLLADDDQPVRLAAIHAAAQMGAPELIESLINGLSHPRLRRASMTALAKMGPHVMDDVETLLENASTPSSLRVALVQTLAKLPPNVVERTLLSYIEDRDPRVRTAAIQESWRLHTQIPTHEFGLPRWVCAIRNEAQVYYQWLALAEDLKLEHNDDLLIQDALSQRQEQARNRVLGLLALRYRPDTVRLVAQNLNSSAAATRANAVEILDNLLDKHDKRLVVPMLDDPPPDQKIAVGAERFPLERYDSTEALKVLLQCNDPWLQCCAAMTVAERKLNALEDDVAALLESSDPIGRETAAVALRRLHEQPTTRARE